MAFMAPLEPPPLQGRAPPEAPPVHPEATAGTAWQVRSAAGESGRLELHDVKTLIRSGALVPDDLALAPGEQEWRRAGDAPALAKWFAIKAGSTAAPPVPGSAQGPARAPAVSEAPDPRIKNAVAAGAICAVLTALASLLMGPAMLVDAALVAGLTFGVSRRSRACAVVLLVYYVAAKIYMLSQAGAPRGIFVSILFAWYFLQGVQATFAAHAERTSKAP
jgi:serine/threonine-protein kinase